MLTNADVEVSSASTESVCALRRLPRHNVGRLANEVGVQSHHEPVVQDVLVACDRVGQGRSYKLVMH